MPNVSVDYKMYLPAGHHRQPRNASVEIELAHGGEFGITNPGTATPNYFTQLTYTIPAGSGMANLIFWNVTDGISAGKVYGPGPLTQAVGANALTITAWYWPVTGPAAGPSNGKTAIIDDAFSAIQGRFIDDTFVTVSSDPALTSDANVIGIVPTNVAETLVAAHSVASTTEPFSQWICSDAGMAAGDTVQVPAAAGGIAIAIYQRSNVVFHPPTEGEIYWPSIDPWGPVILRLVRSALVAAAAKSLDKRVAAEVGRLAANDAIEATKLALREFEKFGEEK